jgi:geranylgeranyl pyrophosphate synthase
VENMHRRKTGALIQCSVLLGATAAGLTDGPKFAALRKFGADIGLAFQIQDDILDIEGETAVIGKSAGADIARNKPTYPSTIGLEASREKARALCDGAIAALAPIGSAAAALTELARYVVNRSQ